MEYSYTYTPVAGSGGQQHAVVYMKLVMKLKTTTGAGSPQIRFFNHKDSKRACIQRNAAGTEPRLRLNPPFSVWNLPSFVNLGADRDRLQEWKAGLRS